MEIINVGINLIHLNDIKMILKFNVYDQSKKAQHRINYIIMYVCYKIMWSLEFKGFHCVKLFVNSCDAKL